MRTTRLTDPLPRALADVRMYHRIGRDSLDRVPETVYGGTKAEAERLRVDIAYVRAARVFAADYDRDRLDTLCEVCRRGKYPIGWSRVILLLGVPDQDRDQFLASAIAGKWSRRHMAAEIRRRFGVRRKPGAGRPTKLDAGDPPDAAYQKGLELCMKFESFMASMRRQGEDGKTLLGSLPPSTRACLTRAEDAMGALRNALEPKVTAVRER